MERPTGVTILAVLMFIGAALLTIGGFVLIFIGAALGSKSASPGPGMMILAGMGAMGGVVILVLAAIYVVLAIGMLKLANWARVITIVLIGIGLVFAVLGLLAGVAPFNALLSLRQLVVIAIDIWIIWYLLRPHVKQAFGATGL